MIQDALGYAAMGWPVLPVHSINGDGQCTCGRLNCRSAGKHPLIEHGLTDATTSEGKIMEWWQAWPWANIGVLTGEQSGIVVLDIDDADAGGLDGKKVPDTIVSRTGSGGTHLIYQHPGVPVKSTTRVLPGIDSRGDGGYILVPPSKHKSGNSYEWIIDPWSRDPAPCPQFWLDEVTGDKKKERVITAPDDAIAEGGRNNYLTSKAGYLRRAGMDLAEMEIALLMLNKSKCKPPLDDDEVLIIARSVSGYSIKTPEEIELEQHGDSILQAWAESKQAQIAEMLATRPKTTKAGPAPDGIMPPTGNLISDIANEILNSSIRPQKNLAIAAAIAFVGVCMGQRYQSETGLRSNVYMIGLAESGSGKDHARKCIKQLAADCGCLDLIGGDTVASAQGIQASLQKSPCRMYLFDEFGLMLKEMNNSGGPQREIMSLLMKLYSSAGSILYGTEYADQKLRPQVNIIDPCCCMYSVSTHGTFYDALSGGDAASGAIARMMIFNDGETRGKRQRPVPFAPEQTIAGRIKAIVSPVGKSILENVTTGELATKKPVTVPMVSDVYDAYERFDDELTERMTDPATRAIYSRVAENAIKLALIYAVAQDSSNPWIDHHAWVWGRDIALWCANYIVEQFQTMVSDTDTERQCRRVTRVIHAFGERGCDRRTLSRKLHMLKKERDQILEILVEAGDIVINIDENFVCSEFIK